MIVHHEMLYTLGWVAAGAALAIGWRWWSKRRRIERRRREMTWAPTLSIEDAEDWTVRPLTPKHQPTEPFEVNEPFSGGALGSTEQRGNLGDRNILQLRIVADEGQSFVGYELLQSLLNLNLHYGQHGMFHRHAHRDGTGRILYTVASLDPPGGFSMDQMGGTRAKALCAFMRVEGAGIDRLKLFFEDAHDLASDLGGMLCDDQGILVSLDTYARYKACLKTEEASY